MGAREAVGKIYSDLKSKQQDQINPFEFTKAIGKEFMPQMVEMVEKDKLKTNKDFFVEVCIFMNPILVNPETGEHDTPEYRLISRFTCPTPFHDRGVFRYVAKEDRIEFLWFVPSPKECHYYMANMLNLGPDEKDAAKMVMAYRDGTLLRIAKQLNGEKSDEALIFYRKDADGQPATS